ncbi:MAG: RidA family protein [Pseudomonadota bacterium]
MASTRSINPWSWQDQYGFSQGVEVTGQQRVLVCSGQTSVDNEGRPLHPGDMAAQLTAALDNLQQLLAHAGMGFDNIVRLNYYTTDVSAYLQASGIVATRFSAGVPRPAGTLLGVASLFHPDILIEIEATAVA